MKRVAFITDSFVIRKFWPLSAWQRTRQNRILPGQPKICSKSGGAGHARSKFGRDYTVLAQHIKQPGQIFRGAPVFVGHDVARHVRSRLQHQAKVVTDNVLKILVRLKGHRVGLLLGLQSNEGGPKAHELAQDDVSIPDLLT